MDANARDTLYVSMRNLSLHRFVRLGVVVVAAVVVALFPPCNASMRKEMRVTVTR